MSLGDKKPEVDIDIVASLGKTELGAGSESVDAEHMSLLTAFQDFVITLVSSGDRDKQNDQLSVSPKAGKLILALQEFVSGIIKGSKSGVRSMIQADLTEDEDMNEEHTTDEKGV
ncbi:hypothetical protein BDN70DRAFT_146906 [Pholiota conissans]|uniref:Uncharacterized protein n=1 Tax=Pholiota conissans TaxID=109636 RepID=A0A9P6CYQ2_9AGAR|nr:hypothetical protein BDN70DRAFT_146906 [Pholiota conissans]